MFPYQVVKVNMFPNFGNMVAKIINDNFGNLSFLIILKGMTMNTTV